MFIFEGNWLLLNRFNFWLKIFWAISLIILEVNSALKAITWGNIRNVMRSKHFSFDRNLLKSNIFQLIRMWVLEFKPKHVD